MNAMKKLICLLLMLCAGTAAFAWGGREHRLIAYIAEAHLTPRTRQVLDRYLDQSIVEYSTWMDRYRTAPGYEITTYWHMVTIDKDGSVPPEPLRPNGDGDAVRQLTRAIERLRNYRELSDSTVNVNLKYIIHLVGEMHCPGHIYFADLPGGMDAPRHYDFFLLKYKGKEVTYHWVWDGSVSRQYPDWTEEDFRRELDKWPVLQPEKFRDPAFLDALQALQPDLGIVIAFKMLPEVVWAMPRLGTFNLHASLLPEYRGAAPINWAIINGERETGITTFLLNHEIDKGAILAQERVAIAPEDNVGTLYERLMLLGAELVTATVDRIAAGDCTPAEQMHFDESRLHPAPKIFKEDCRIDWRQPGERIVNLVRGLSPYPAAWTPIFKKGEPSDTAKIFAVHFEPGGVVQRPGTVETDKRTYLAVACADGRIVVDELQIAGKRRMSARDLLPGMRDLADYSFGEEAAEA